MAPRGKYERKQKATGAVVAANVVTIVPEQVFTSLPWWSKLNTDEQKDVKSEGQQLASALLQHGYSRLAVGEHLSKLRDILEPHNLFGKFLRNFHFSKRTAYRYVAGYQNAKARLPEPILKAAMARGYNIIGDTDRKPLGVYTEAAAALPPPQNPTQEQAVTWLDQVESVRKKTRSTGESEGVTSFETPVPQDPNTLLKECYRFVNARYKRLPNNSRTRSAWVRNLVGLLLADLGVSGQQTFAPQAVPEEFKAQRGRPRLAATA